MIMSQYLESKSNKTWVFDDLVEGSMLGDANQANIIIVMPISSSETHCDLRTYVHSLTCLTGTGNNPYPHFQMYVKSHSGDINKKVPHSKQQTLKLKGEIEFLDKKDPKMGTKHLKITSL